MLDPELVLTKSCVSQNTLLPTQAWQSLAQQQTASEHQQQAAAAQSRRRLQQAWKVWQQHACARLQTVCRHRQHRLKHVALCSWAALPAVNLRLRAIAAAVSSSYTRLLLQWGFRAFYSCCSDAVAVRRSARECLKAWCRAAAGSARQRRLLGARAHARRHAVLQAVMRCWAQAAWRSVHQAAACKMLALEVGRPARRHNTDWCMYTVYSGLCMKQATQVSVCLSACCAPCLPTWQAALSLSDAQLQFRQTEVHALQSHQQELARLVATASNAAAPGERSRFKCSNAPRSLAVKPSMPFETKLAGRQAVCVWNGLLLKHRHHINLALRVQSNMLLCCRSPFGPQPAMALHGCG